MRSTRIALCALVSIGLAAVSSAADGLTDAQEKIAKVGPKNMRLMIAGFGTVESMTQVDKWLGEQLQPNENLKNLPTLSAGEKLQVPELANFVVRANWNTRKLEYVHDANLLRAQNERDRMMLTALRTRVLTDSATRYVPLAKDYLQAALSRKAGSLIQVIDRSNADMALVEQGLNGSNDSALAGATCIATVALGDREEDSRTITVNGKGTQVKVTTYTQPYVGKVRDLNGNVLVAFNGIAEWSSQVNSVVKSTVSDPARKLVEAACDKIADEIVAFFTTKLEFKVKVPAGVDPDDVTVTVDGRSVDPDEGARVLAVEHAIVASLEGCAPIRKVVEINDQMVAKTVKLNFKKPE